MIKPQGSRHVPLHSLRTLTLPAVFSFLLAQGGHVQQMEVIGCLSEIQIYLPSLWPYPGMCHGCVFALCHWSLNPGLGELCTPLEEVGTQWGRHWALPCPS